MLPLERARTKTSAELLMTGRFTELHLPGGFYIKSWPFHILLKHPIFAWPEGLRSGSWRKFAVILPYNESDRGGIETAYSKIDLGVLGRLKRKPGCSLLRCFHQTAEAGFRGVGLFHLKLQDSMRKFFRRVPERKEKKKGVTSQVLRCQGQ